MFITAVQAFERYNIMRIAILRLVIMGVILFLLTTGSDALGDTVIFQNGFSNAFVTDYAGLEDNMLINNSKSSQNYGDYEAIIVGDATWSDTDTSRGLMRFDLSSMAGEYSVINSVTLRLRKRDANPREVSVYSILTANKSWVMGTASGTQQTGSSCWDYAVDPTATWAGSDGCGTAGTDYDANALATVTMPTMADQFVDFVFTGWTTAELKSLIDLWSGPKIENAGILLKATEEGNNTYGAAFISNEFNPGDGYTAADRPQLIIDFTPVPEPSAFVILLSAALGLVALSRRRS